MKKTFIRLLSAILCLFLLSGCGIFPAADKGEEVKCLLVKADYYEDIETYEYEFDENDRIVKRITYSNGYECGYDLYDENENIIESYYDGQLYFKNEYDDGKLVKTYTYSDGEITGYSIFIDISPTIRDEIRYDASQDPDGKVMDFWNREILNEKGQVIESYYNSVSNTINGGRTTYTYDEHGNMTESSYYHPAWQDGTTYYTYVTKEEYLGKGL